MIPNYLPYLMAYNLRSYHYFSTHRLPFLTETPCVYEDVRSSINAASPQFLPADLRRGALLELFEKHGISSGQFVETRVPARTDRCAGICAITGKILIEKCEFAQKHGVAGEFGHKFGEQLTGRLVLAFADQRQC